MRKAKIKIVYPKRFETNQYVEFIVTFSKKKFKTFRGVITQGLFNQHYYICFEAYNNEGVFKYANIDKKSFCSTFLNMKKIEGSWPEVDSLTQLRHMLETLEHLDEF